MERQSGSGCSGAERERISRCTYGDADSVPVRPDPDRKDEKAGNRVVDESFYLPVNENNLAYQAADLLMKEFDVKEGKDHP